MFKENTLNEVEIVGNKEFKSLLNKVDSQYGLLPPSIKEMTKISPRGYEFLVLDKLKKKELKNTMQLIGEYIYLTFR